MSFSKKEKELYKEKCRTVKKITSVKDVIIKAVSGKLPLGKFPPIKLPPGKFPPGIFPPMFLNIPTRVFKFFVFSLLSPSSLILLKRLFCSSMF